MKEYRVGVHFEEGFVVRVNANSEEEAHKKVFDRVDDYGTCTIRGEVPEYHNKDVVHRDWQIVEIEEERDLEPKAKEYRVSFVPTEPLTYSFTVEASSEEEAGDIALQDLQESIGWDASKDFEFHDVEEV